MDGGVPIVLVPGFLGNESHWHLDYLRDSYPSVTWVATSPGPLSSHHDRAAEVFYTLKGGTVDYGEEHARRCGHARFGRTHSKGALSQWDADHPIDCLGHSIGGVTLRVLQRMLHEQAFPGYETSAAWIRSITTLASPHNGDPVVYGLGISPLDAIPPSQTMLRPPPCCPCPWLGSLHHRAGSCCQCAQPMPHRPCMTCPSSSLLQAPPPPPPPPPRLQEGDAARAHGRLPQLPSASRRATQQSSASAVPGSSAVDEVGTPTQAFSTGWLVTLAAHCISYVDSPTLNGLLDLQLDHWYLSRKQHPFLSSLGAFVRALTWRRSVGQSEDNAAWEVQPAVTRQLNTATHPHTVYLSIATHRRPARQVSQAMSEPTAWRVVHALGREVAVLGFSCLVRLGRSSLRAAACARFFEHPSDWNANDGLLSVHGQRAPFGEPSTPLRLADPSTSTLVHLTEASTPPRGRLPDTEHIPPTPSTGQVVSWRTGMTAECAPEDDANGSRQPLRPTGGRCVVEAHQGAMLPPGVWHVLELDAVDHFAVCGGPLVSRQCMEQFWSLYMRLREAVPAHP